MVVSNMLTSRGEHESVGYAIKGTQEVVLDFMMAYRAQVWLSLIKVSMKWYTCSVEMDCPSSRVYVEVRRGGFFVFDYWLRQRRIVEVRYCLTPCPSGNDAKTSSLFHLSHSALVFLNVFFNLIFKF
jgi:hypothetical protein